MICIQEVYVCIHQEKMLKQIKEGLLAVGLLADSNRAAVIVAPTAKTTLVLLTHWLAICTSQVTVNTCTHKGLMQCLTALTTEDDNTFVAQRGNYRVCR